MAAEPTSLRRVRVRCVCPSQLLKDRFYRPPRIGEEGEEKDMCDIANIVFVFIEVFDGLRMVLISTCKIRGPSVA